MSRMMALLVNAGMLVACSSETFVTASVDAGDRRDGGAAEDATANPDAANGGIPCGGGFCVPVTETCCVAGADRTRLSSLLTAMKTGHCAPSGTCAPGTTPIGCTSPSPCNALGQVCCSRLVTSSTSYQVSRLECTREADCDTSKTNDIVCNVATDTCPAGSQCASPPDPVYDGVTICRR